MIEPKTAIHGSYNNSDLGKDKSSIDITRTNPKKFQKYNSANRAEEKTKKKQKKVQGKEEKPEIISTNSI